MKRTYLAAAVFLIVAAIYAAGLSPTITSDDSGELSAVAATLGIAHSPGYPLYSVVGRVFQTIFPFANPAYRANLVSALPSAAGTAMAFLFFAAVSGSAASAFFAALALGISAFLYETATATEVYGLSFLFAAAMAAVLTSEISESKKIRLAFFIWGLAFVSHYIAVFWLPALIYYAYKKGRRNAREAASWAFFAAMGGTPVLFIFLRAVGGALYSWEDPRTAARFFDVVLRARYGAANLAQGDMNVFDLPLWLPKLIFLAGRLNHSFTLAGLAAGAAGMALVLARRKTPGIGAVGVFLTLFFAGSGPGFLILANVGVDKTSSALMSRFLYPAAFVWCAFISVALARLKDKRLIAAAGFLLASAAARGSIFENSSRHHFTFYDYAVNLLKNTPPGALVIYDRADEMEFCVSYLMRIEARRPDARFIDANAGVSKSVYGEDYYKIWGQPRLDRRNIVEERLVNLAAQEGKSAYYATFLPRQTKTPKTPWGLLHLSAGPARADIMPDEVFVLRAPEKEIRSEALHFSHFSILGDYYASKNDPERAERNFYAAAAKDIGALHRLGYFHYIRGEKDKAAAIFGLLSKARPGDADARLNLGVLAEGRKDFAEAERLYKEAARISPDAARTHYNLGSLYWKLSRWDDAQTAFRKASSLDPQNPDYRRYADGASARKNQERR